MIQKGLKKDGDVALSGLRKLAFSSLLTSKSERKPSPAKEADQGVHCREDTSPKVALSGVQVAQRLARVQDSYLGFESWLDSWLDFVFLETSKK